MIIELSLIQNFLLALFTVFSLGVIVFCVKSILSKKKALPHSPAKDKYTKTDSDIKRYDTVNAQQITSISEKEEAETNYKKIIKLAQLHAKSLLYETSREAGRILTETKKTNEKMEEDLDKVLHQVAENDIRTLKSTIAHFDATMNQNIATIQTQMQTSMNEMITNTKTHYDQKLDEFMKELMNKGLVSTSEVDKKTAELISKAEQEIEEYKKNKFAQVDEHVNQVVQKVYRDILRTSMPENTHQDLLVKSLEQAKKDGLFKF